MLSDELFERCLRVLYHAPADKPSLALLLDMHGGTEGLRNALWLAFEAGRESAYDRDEWRVRYLSNPDPGTGERFPALYGSYDTRDEAEQDVAEAKKDGYHEPFIVHRRSGKTPWVRVPEAGGTGANA